MKNVFFLACITFFAIGESNGQIEKGSWLVGGSAGFTSDDHSSPLEKSTVVVFDVSLNAGYFFISKLAVGLKPSYSFESYKGTTGTPIKVHNWYAGPFVRYYFLPNDRMANFFAESSYAYGTSRYAGQSSHSNKYTFLGGPVIFLNSAVGLELTIGYTIEKYNTINQARLNTFQTGIGLQFHLPKED